MSSFSPISSLPVSSISASASTTDVNATPAVMTWEAVNSTIAAMETEDFILLWNVADDVGLLHWYRVIGDPQAKGAGSPANEPGDETCGSGAGSCAGGSRTHMLLLAKDLNDLCEKIAAKGNAFPVFSVARYDPAANELKPLDVTVVDVTEEFFDTYGCSDYAPSLTLSLTDAEIEMLPIEADELSPFDANVLTGCCPTITAPVLLELKHNLNRTDGFYNFITYNGFELQNPIKLIHNKVSGFWQYNFTKKGLAIEGSGSQTWNLSIQFGCQKNPFGPTDLDSQKVWKFELSGNTKFSGKAYNSKIIHFFDTDLVCSNGFPIMFDLSIDPRTGSTSPAGLFDGVFRDGAKMFASRYWRDNPARPTIDFHIKQVGQPDSIDVVYPELRVPLRRPVRGAKPVLT